MRVLICAPHFYDPDRTSAMGSTTETRDERIRVSQAAIRSWAALVFGRHYFLGTADTLANDRCAGGDTGISGDIVLCTLSDRNLFAALSNGVNVHQSMNADDPRFLGYAVRRVFAAHAKDYDLFVYIEDDFAINDPAFLTKVAGFYRLHGERRVLLPNRMEHFGRRDLAVKVYLDRDHPQDYQISAESPDVPLLTVPMWPDPVELELTTSVSSGAFVITGSQLDRWMAQPDYRNPEQCRPPRMHPLEMAQVPLAGRLPVYRPSARNPDFLEIHHLSGRLSGGRTPSALLKAEIKPLLSSRSPLAV